MSRTFLDVKGRPLQVGDEVCFISAPQCLNYGTLVGFRAINPRMTMAEIVVTISNGETRTLTVDPHLACKLS